MNFAFPNSALDAFYLRLNLKDQVKNLKITLNYFPGSGFGKRRMLSGLWFPPQVIRFSELGSGCILSMLSKWRLKVFHFILLFPDCIVCIVFPV